MSRPVEGEVDLLRCVACGAQFPHFVFSGDTDALTIGLACATGLAGHDLVLGVLTPEELNGRDEGLAAFAQRAGAGLGRDDLRSTRLLRAEGRGPSGKGLSLQAFLSLYQPPLLFYRCICCDTGEAQSVKHMTAETFMASGGHLLLLDDLKLVSRAAN